MEVQLFEPDSNKQEMEIELNRAKIKELETQEQILSCIVVFERLLGLNVDPNDSLDPDAPMKIAFKFYGNDTSLPPDFDFEKAKEKKTKHLNILGDLRHKANHLGISQNETTIKMGCDMTIEERISRCIQSCYGSYQLIVLFARAYDRMYHPTIVPTEKTFFDSSTIDLENTSPYQNFLLTLLDSAYKEEYRRYKGQVCRQITTDDRYKTKAWEPVMTIEEFVHDVANKDVRFDVWKDMTSRGGCAADAARHLNVCKDIQFPEIKKNRSYFSFRNGVFAAKLLNAEGKYVCRFFPYKSPEFRTLDPSTVSCKYFDKVFLTSKDEIDFEMCDWEKIPTPHFQSIA